MIYWLLICICLVYLVLYYTLNKNIKSSHVLSLKGGPQLILHVFHFMAVIQNDPHQLASSIKTGEFYWSKVLLHECPHWQQLVHSDYEDTRVLLNSASCTISINMAIVNQKKIRSGTNFCHFNLGRSNRSVFLHLTGSCQHPHLSSSRFTCCRSCIAGINIGLHDTSNVHQ